MNLSGPESCEDVRWTDFKAADGKTRFRRTSVSTVQLKMATEKARSQGTPTSISESFAESYENEWADDGTPIYEDIVLPLEHPTSPPQTVAEHIIV